MFLPSQTSVKHKINSAYYIISNSDRPSFFRASVVVLGSLTGINIMRSAEGRNYVNLSGHCSATRCAANIASAICFNLTTSVSNEALSGGPEGRRIWKQKQQSKPENQPLYIQTHKQHCCLLIYTYNVFTKGSR